MTGLTERSKVRKGTAQTLIFLHIPKAAGTTMLPILVRQYEKKSVLPVYGENKIRGIEAIEKIRDFPAEQRMRIRVLVGHMKFGLHEYLKPPATYITFLRRPIERIVSQYNYVRRNPDHYLFEKFMAKDMDIGEFVASGISDETDNGQTRLISGAGDSIPFGECSPDLLQIAKKNISEHFAFVGLSERFDESLLIMKDMFGWKNPYYKSRNVAKSPVSKESLSKEIQEIITKYNELDLQLYDFAEKRFVEIVAGQPPSFAEKLHRFQKLNRYYGRLDFILKRTISKGKKLSIELN